MPTHDAEAVVLRQYALAEADRIIILFSKEFGKVRAVAQGAKRPKSRLGGCLEPLTHVRIRYYIKEGSDLGKIHQCELIHAYLGHGIDLERLYGYTYFSEIVQELVQENNPNYLIFRLFIASLNAGEKIGVSEALVRYFELWSLKLSGLLPNYDTCSKCGKCVKDVGFYAWLEAGQGRCAECSNGRGLSIRPAAARVLQDIAVFSPEEFAIRQLDAGAASDIEKLTHRHFEWQVEKRLKSYPALREALQKSRLR